MNKAAFLQIVRQVSPIQDQEVEDLEKLVVSFPYCQTAHVLLAKAAYDRGSMLSTQKLRKAAAHVSNRQLLKRLVYDYEVAMPVADEVETIITSPEPVFAETENSVLGLLSENEAENNAPFLFKDEIENDEDYESDLIQNDSSHSEEEVVIDPSVLEEAPEGEPEIAVTQELEVAPESTSPPELYTYSEADEAVSFLEEVELSKLSPAEEVSNKSEFESAEAESLEKQPEEEPEPSLVEVLATAENPAQELMAQEAINAGEPVPEDELLDLIQIKSLVSYTPASKSVNLTHQEIVSEIVSATEAKQKALDTPLLAEAETANVVLVEDQETAASLPSVSLENQLAEAAAPLPEEAGYAFPTLQLPKSQNKEGEQELAEDPYLAIYNQNSLGFWMGSSRLGESIQLKDDLTSSLPNYFQPALIIEHVKGNGTFQKEAEKTPVAKLDIQLDIINQFLKTTPRRKTLANVQQNHEPQEDLSAKSVKIKKNFASENLAQIFVKQGKVKKAVKIYEQLIVKFPEKKSYFAQQIEKLRNDT